MSLPTDSEDENGAAAFAAAAAKGDLCAYSEFADRLGPRVLGFFIKRLSDRHTAEDLTQITFANAWHAWKQYDSSISTLAWIYEIAGNVLRDYIRQVRALKREQSRTVLLGDHNPVFDKRRPSHASPLSNAIASEGESAFLNAMHQLTPIEQRIFDLNEEGIPYAEIAAATGKTENAVGSLLSRVRQKLRKILKSHLG